MSFDLAVLSSARPLEPDEAALAYERLCDGENWSSVLQQDGRVADFVREITTRWPQIDDVPDDQVDNCPWSIAFDVSPAHVIMCMRFSAVDDVAPVCVDTALRYGLNIYDPQVGALHSPGRPPRAITPSVPKARICAGCGQPIGPSEPAGKRLDVDGVFHIGCLFPSRASGGSAP